MQPSWLVKGAPSIEQPLCGFDMAVGVNFTTVYKATPAIGTYNHAAMMDWHDDNMLLSWKNSPRDEDTPGQRILFSQSADGLHWTPTDGNNVLFPNLTSNARPASLFGGPTIILNGRRYASASPSQFCLFPYPYASSPTAVEPGNLLLLRRVGPGIPSLLGPTFWSSASIPRGFEEASAREKVIPSADTDATTQADLALLTKLSSGEGVPCLTEGRTTKCEACAGGCGQTTSCERAHYMKPGGGDVIVTRSDFKSLNYSYRPSPSSAWSASKRTDIPDVGSNMNAGTLPNGRAFLVSNVCPQGGDVGATRDPLVVASTADGWAFDRAVAVMSCVHFGGCQPRFRGAHKNPGPSYPQAVVVEGKGLAAGNRVTGLPDVDGLFIVATNNKEDVVVARVPFEGL